MAQRVTVDGRAQRRDGTTSAPGLRLSVLDQTPVSDGSTPAAALHDTVDLARLADELGYYRYWVAEHHGSPMVACTSPEALIGPIAAETSRVRVGSGGVMLPHYSPFKVAETFSMLAGLFPSRIDVGVGRAAGTDPTTARALQRDQRARIPDDFPQQLAELLAYLEDELPPNHPFARLAKALPGLPERPEVWLLGSSRQSGLWAAEAGLPYAFADFIHAGGEPIAARYRETFAPGPRLAAPRVIVAAWVICAETDEDAERLAASHRMAFRLLHRGELIAVPRVETALRWLEEHGPEEAAGLPLAVAPARRRIVGSPATVRAEIETLARGYGAEEVMIVTITHDHEARRRSYELIADAFDMAPRPHDAAAGAA